MNIDRIEFLAWMERLMGRLDMLGDNIDELQRKRNSIDGEELLDNQDLLQMLKISNRSLQRYRSIGKLPYGLPTFEWTKKLREMSLTLDYNETSKEV